MENVRRSGKDHDCAALAGATAFRAGTPTLRPLRTRRRPLRARNLHACSKPVDGIVRTRQYGVGAAGPRLVMGHGELRIHRVTARLALRSLGQGDGWHQAYGRLARGRLADQGRRKALAAIQVTERGSSGGVRSRKGPGQGRDGVRGRSQGADLSVRAQRLLQDGPHPAPISWGRRVSVAASDNCWRLSQPRSLTLQDPHSDAPAPLAMARVARITHN